MLTGAFLWANNKTASPTGETVSLYSEAYRFGSYTADCKTNRMLGVDFHDRVTAVVIGISHSAEYLWRGQLKPHGIKQRLLLTAVKGSRNPAESAILRALKGFCSSAAERMPYKRVIRVRLPAEPPQVECV